MLITGINNSFGENKGYLLTFRALILTKNEEIVEEEIFDDRFWRTEEEKMTDDGQQTTEDGRRTMDDGLRTTGESR
jgi:hypothetical protein